MYPQTLRKSQMVSSFFATYTLCPRWIAWGEVLLSLAVSAAMWVLCLAAAQLPVRRWSAWELGWTGAAADWSATCCRSVDRCWALYWEVPPASYRRVRDASIAS